MILADLIFFTFIALSMAITAISVFMLWKETNEMSDVIAAIRRRMDYNNLSDPEHHDEANTKK